MDSEDRKLRTLRILLVDDDPELRALLDQSLRRFPFEFEIARCGEGVLRRFRQALNSRRLVDLVVLDVSMPDKDGFEVAREIRELDKEVPIIFLSGIDDPQGAYEAKQVGALDYLIKPDGLVSLPHVICKYFELGTDEVPCTNAGGAM